MAQSSSLVPQAEGRIWACALNAFAVASGVVSSRIEILLGHDGGAIVQPELQTSERFAGFTDLEITRALYLLGKEVVHIELDDLSLNLRLSWRDSICYSDKKYVLYYMTSAGMHAVAGYKYKVIDMRKDGEIDIRDIDPGTFLSIYVLRDTLNG